MNRKPGLQIPRVLATTPILRRASVIALMSAASGASALPAQSNHIDHQAFVAQTSFGISIGRTGGQQLWTVDGQPLLSQFAGPTIVGVGRSTNSTITLDANVMHYLSRHVALGGVFEYVGATYADVCHVTQDGGDPILAALCGRMNQSNFPAGVSLYGIQGRYRLSTSTVLQPIATLTVGLASTPTNPVAMSATAQGDQLVLYLDPSWSSAHLTEGLSVGFQTAPRQQFQFRAEIRALRVGEAAVTGPAASQETIPPIRATTRTFFSAVVGLDFVLSSTRSKRY